MKHRGAQGSVSHKMAAINKAERGGVREGGMGVWSAVVWAVFPTHKQGGKMRLETLTPKRAVGKAKGVGEAQAPGW